MAQRTNSPVILPPPVEDFIYKNFTYRPDARGVQPCYSCHRIMDSVEYRPNFCARVCDHWFHSSCLVDLLCKDRLPKSFRDCYICRLNHYTARWKGPVVLSLSSMFPRCEVPDIRACLTKTDIKARLERVLARDMWRPWFPEIMDFCMEPEEVEGGLGALPEVDREEVHKGAARLFARRMEVREYRRR